jgi:hypothetical protein
MDCGAGQIPGEVPGMLLLIIVRERTEIGTFSGEGLFSALFADFTTFRPEKPENNHSRR